MRDDEHHERPSKSARKRESTSLQQLGEALIGLPEAALRALPLPETLLDAVLLARRITSHAAQLRQRQYIGKLMRRIDAEPIRLAIEQQRERQRLDARRFHRVEQWRDRLIAEGATAMEELLEVHPQTDVSRLQRLVVEARSEIDARRPPRAARELFQCLRDILEREAD